MCIFVFLLTSSNVDLYPLEVVGSQLEVVAILKQLVFYWYSCWPGFPRLFLQQCSAVNLPLPPHCLECNVDS
jgi:hypothetical protein